MEWWTYAASAALVLAVLAGIVALNRNADKRPRTPEQEAADRAESQTFSM